MYLNIVMKICSFFLSNISLCYLFFSLIRRLQLTWLSNNFLTSLWNSPNNVSGKNSVRIYVYILHTILLHKTFILKYKCTVFWSKMLINIFFNLSILPDIVNRKETKIATSCWWIMQLSFSTRRLFSVP